MGRDDVGRQRYEGFIHIVFDFFHVEHATFSWEFIRRRA
jgi:hypothetical protein